jgi:tetratricopeptide (TPR) repeat protein
MARSARSRARPPTGWPAIEAGILDRLRREPQTRHVAWVLVLAVAALYGAGLDYPLVVGDFAFLGPQQFEAYVRAQPALGGSWLADASLGWSAAIAGSHWPAHRIVHLALHAGAVLVAFALFRRIVAAAGNDPEGAGSGWVAFLGCALFALHPAAVYAVAYLSARYAVLLGLFALIALWSTARSVQDGGRSGWVIGPAATAGALACSPAGLGVPVAMAFLALALPAAAGKRRDAWVGIALAVVAGSAYAVALALAPAPTGATGYLDALAGASTRFLHYLGLWLVPVTAVMAIDMPQAAVSAAQAWPGWLAVAGVAAIAMLIGVALGRRRTPGLVRVAAIGAGIPLALYSGELLWPRLGAELALPRSYVYLPCAVLIPACLARALPLRSGWIAASIVLRIWLAAAAAALQTFATQAALWDDAVRRVELLGAKPEDARVYLNRATLHRREGHSLAAAADYDRALALQPDLTRALRGRAQVYIDEKRFGEALRDLDRVLELEPTQAITHADRGLALMQAGRLQDAARAFDRAIERGVKEPRVFLNRGLARLQTGGVAAAPAALADIERALELDPQYALAYFNRAMVFELAANAGMRLRDALSPELMRAVAGQNLARACELGYRAACERQRAQAADAPPGAQEGAIRVTPEWLRQQGMPAPR